MLAEEEGEQHQHASIMYDPPDVNVTLCEAFSVRWEGRDVLGHQQGFTGSGGFSYQLCNEDTSLKYLLFTRKHILFLLIETYVL